MVGINYVAAQIVAVWYMALDRDDWRDRLDRSLDGVFRSLQAIVFGSVAAALKYILVWQTAGKSSVETYAAIADKPALLFVAESMTGFLLDWGLSILLLVMIARSLKAEHRAADIIVGYNWAMLAYTLVELEPVVLFALTGSDIVLGVAAIPVLAFQLVLLFGVMRRGFGTSVAISIAIILMLSLMSILSFSIVGGFFSLFTSQPVS